MSTPVPVNSCCAFGHVRRHCRDVIDAQEGEKLISKLLDNVFCAYHETPLFRYPFIAAA
jgi:hypothetical protein